MTMYIVGQESHKKRKSSKISWSMEEDDSLILLVESQNATRDSIKWY